MKPTLFAAMLLLLSLPAFAQTYDLELAWIKKNRADNKITQEQAAENKSALDRLIKEGLYPILPYDTSTHEVVFEQVLECPGVPKAMIFKRIREWCEVMYGKDGTAVRYEDFDNGKIVAKGYMNVRYVKTSEKLFGGEARTEAEAQCAYSLVFTIKDDKFKVAARQLNYVITTPGSIQDSMYVPEMRHGFSLAGILPIMTAPASKRKGLLELIRNSMALLDASGSGLLKYVKAWEADQKF